jgi:transposase-like protein
MVASAIRSVFEQPDARSARDQLDRVIDGMAGATRRSELLADAEADLLSHFAVPETHRARFRSTGESVTGTAPGR